MIYEFQNDLKTTEAVCHICNALEEDDVYDKANFGFIGLKLVLKMNHVKIVLKPTPYKTDLNTSVPRTQIFFLA